MKSVIFKCEDEEHTKVKTYCVQNKISMNDFYNKLTKEFFDKSENKKEEK